MPGDSHSRRAEVEALDALERAYANYARAADGAGAVQAPVVQRLVEAVYNVMEARAANPRPLDTSVLRIAIMRALEQTDDPHSPWTAFADRVVAEYAGLRQ